MFQYTKTEPYIWDQYSTLKHMKKVEIDAKNANYGPSDSVTSMIITNICKKIEIKMTQFQTFLMAA